MYHIKHETFSVSTKITLLYLALIYSQWAKRPQKQGWHSTNVKVFNDNERKRKTAKFLCIKDFRPVSTKEESIPVKASKIFLSIDKQEQLHDNTFIQKQPPEIFYKIRPAFY